MRVKGMMAGLATLLGIAAALACLPGYAGAEQPGHQVNLAGLIWHGSLSKAMSVAAKEGKPVLHLQMFGRLDDALC